MRSRTGDAVTREAGRRDRLRAVAAERGLDAVLVTNLLNVRYLTGFTGSNGALLLRADGDDVLGTDGRYTTQAGIQVPDLELLIDRATVPALAARAAGRGAPDQHPRAGGVPSPLLRVPGRRRGDRRARGAGLRAGAAVPGREGGVVKATRERASQGAPATEERNECGVERGTQ